MSRAVLSFKAGLVDWDDETKQATPKRGQGLVTIAASPDDTSLYQFLWDPRGQHKQKCSESDRVDLLLFPGDSVWEHVSECATGRVFSLAYKSSGQRQLFWMQSPTEDGGNVADLTEEDKTIATKIQKILEDDSMMEVDGDEGMEGEEESGAPAPTENPQTPANSERQTQQPQQPQQTEQSVPVTSITEAVPLSTIVAYVDGLDETKLQDLYNHIPDGIEKTKDNLVRIIRSSQFAQSVESFNSALNNDGVGGMVSQQLGYEYNGEGVEGFLKGARGQGKKDDSDRMEE